MLHDSYIYLDHNATAPMLPAVRDAMLDVMSLPLNPSAQHQCGRYADSLLSDARNNIKGFVGVEDHYEVIFTNSSTVANNIALLGLKDHKLISTSIEHPSILNVPKDKLGVLGVSNDGAILLETLEEILASTSGPRIVSIMLANNETGVVQPLREASHLISKYDDVLLHTDAVQAVGRINIDMEDLGAHMITISSHKVGGPLGAAALIIKPGVSISGTIFGGGQEGGLMPGTENIAAIHGFGMLCQLAAYMPVEYLKIEKMRDGMEESMLAHNKDVIILGKGSRRLPNTSFICMPFISVETQIIHFDINNVCVSSGTSCASGTIKASKAAELLGHEKQVADTGIRVSMGLSNTTECIDKFLELWLSICP